MAWTIVVLSLFLAVASADVLRYGFPTAQEIEKDNGNHWAVLVAGSAGWDNYRHQADACHAYQVLIQHGFSPDRIITMMADDLANSELNPTKGVIINHPKGKDVYKGVKIDYKGKDVNPDVFMAVLKGQADQVKGVGTGRVLKSTGNDHVFVNFVDHGAVGLIGFNDQIMTAKQLMNTINYMHENKMYSEMVLYIEACESGSMFDDLLPDDISVYATTAANGQESSYACYFDNIRDTYLGDVYSVKWMEDSDMEDLKTETLLKQFKIVKRETNTSHVQQFGDNSISADDVAEFQGGKGKDYIAPEPQVLPHVELNAVKSEDVKLSILQHRLAASTCPHERQMLQEHIDWIQQVRARLDSLMSNIVRMATDGDEDIIEFFMTAQYTKLHHDCYEPTVFEFNDRCMRLPQNDYALRKMKVFASLCEAGIEQETIVKSIRKACHGHYYL